jgi:hypothetical protein
MCSASKLQELWQDMSSHPKAETEIYYGRSQPWSWAEDRLQGKRLHAGEESLEHRRRLAEGLKTKGSSEQ